MIPFSFLKNFLKYETWIFSAIGMIFFSVFIFSIPYLPDQDAYFHIKIAELILHNGWIDKLPWMQHSIMAEKYVDYHLLFQIIHIPFILIFKDLILAAKIVNMIFYGFTIYSFNFLIKYLKVKKRWFWFLVFLLASPLFTGRLLFGRGATLYIGIFYFSVYLFIKRNHIFLFILSFFIMWTYPAFLVTIAFLFFYIISALISNEKIYWKPIVYCLSGFTLGLLLHPSFPYQFKGYWLEIMGRFFHPEGLENTGEWSPPNSQIAITGIMLPVGMLIINLIYRKNESVLSRSLLGFSILLLLSYFTASRSIEYLMPVLLLYLSLQPWNRYPEIVRKTFFIIATSFLFFWSIPDNWKRFKDSQMLAEPQADFEAAGWLKNNTPKNSLVMIPWDHFPKFFFKNTHNYYLNGMNPIYSFAFNAEKHSLVRSFFDASAENFYLIPFSIHAKYVVLKISQEHKHAIETLLRISTDKEPDKIGFAKEVFRNYKFIIFEFPDYPPKH